MRAITQAIVAEASVLGGYQANSSDYICIKYLTELTKMTAKATMQCEQHDMDSYHASPLHDVTMIIKHTDTQVSVTMHDKIFMIGWCMYSNNLSKHITYQSTGRRLHQ